MKRFTLDEDGNNYQAKKSKNYITTDQPRQSLSRAKSSA
jgi:hypothetical protein